MTPDIEQLIHDVMHGDADEQTRQRLSDWITQSDANARAYCRVALDERAIRATLERDSARSFAELSEESHNTQADEPAFYNSAQHEAAREAMPTQPSRDGAIRFESTGALTRQQYISALTYVLEHTFTPKRIATLAIAAALLLGAVLAIVLLTGPDESDPLANTPPQSDTHTAMTESPPRGPGRTAAATLTASYNAQWGGPDSVGLDTGAPLRAGQTLTLTQGTAELTTARGAIVSIDAPTRIELVNDNSLHLDTGRLFATVPPKATGFTVETPDARIIDIGTRFGIERLANSNKTHVQVAEGEVRAAAIDSMGEVSPFVPLMAGQAAQITRDTGLARTTYEPARFSDDPGLAHLKPVATQGQFIWSTDAPTDLRNNELEADTPRVFLIKRGMLLEEPVSVDLDGPGTWDDVNFSSQILEAGQRVDVYLAHFDPLGTGDANEKIEYTWSLAFDRPVSGLIPDTRNVAKFNRLLEEHRLGIQFGTQPGQVGPGLEYQRGAGDRLRLNEDGRSIDLHFLVTEGTDQLFILVKSEAADE